MPADESLSTAPSIHHSNAADPYPCYNRPTSPGVVPGVWVKYGYCRHSLDTMCGSSDTRCPKDCRHKAPPDVVNTFNQKFSNPKEGVAVAATFTYDHWDRHPTR